MQDASEKKQDASEKKPVTSEMQVTTLQITPVKGTRVQSVPEIELGPGGAAGDRPFYLIDERGRLRNGKQIGALQAVVAAHRVAADHSETLTLAFPDGSSVGGPVALGERVSTRFYSRPREDRLVIGPWAEALSEFTGERLRLVCTPSAVDRGRRGGVSLVSRASLERLAAVGEQTSIDRRRFRMLIELDGLDAHAEDAWIGRSVRIGADAVIRWNGHVGRCLVTGRDPETGVSDLETLEFLGWYRNDPDTTEPLPFGIYGEVVSPGVVRVGDAVALA